jgi:hypothetical protein
LEGCKTGARQRCSALKTREDAHFPLLGAGTRRSALALFLALFVTVLGTVSGLSSLLFMTTARTVTGRTNPCKKKESRINNDATLL